LSNSGETLEITSEQNSWSTGPSTRSTNSVRRGPPEKRASTSSAPSGRAFSTTSASLSSLAVCRSPCFETLKKQRAPWTPCFIQRTNYTAEYVGYKEAAYALSPAEPIFANVRCNRPLTHCKPRLFDTYAFEGTRNPGEKKKLFKCPLRSGFAINKRAETIGLGPLINPPTSIRIRSRRYFQPSLCISSKSASKISSRCTLRKGRPLAKITPSSLPPATP
jgi:hypothetical protein